MGFDHWTIERIVDTLYGSIWESMNPEHSNSNPVWYASMSNALFYNDFINIPLLMPNAKSIQVRRPIANIIAARSNRKPMPEDFKTKQFYSDSFDTRINNGEVEQICSFYEKYDSLVTEFPNVFLVVPFDELLTDVEVTMKKVADFLKIGFHPNLLKATYNGLELKHNGKKYIGQEHDNIDELLSKEEQSIIQKRIEIFDSSKTITKSDN
jgi:hypothetical protein